MRIRTHRGRKTIGLLLTAALVFTGSAAAFASVMLQPDTENIDGLTPEKEPTDPNAGLPINLLVLGSDSREGDNVDSTDVEGMRSDTAMVLHISADRNRIDVVSIPRDSLVNLPQCPLDDNPNGAKSNAWRGRFNTAFATGAEVGQLRFAIACSVITVRENTGLVMNETIVMDFTGFKAMVDAVGKVEIYTDRPLKSEKAGLDIPAGKVALNGDQALAFTRARYIKGTMNSDLERMERQQQFVGALFRKVLSRETLTSPSALGGFLASVTDSLSVTSGLTLDTMVALAWSLRSIDPTDIRFVTVPVVDSADGTTVEWTSEADAVWNQLKADKPLSEIIEMKDGNGNTVPITTPQPTGAATLPSDN